MENITQKIVGGTEDSKKVMDKIFAGSSTKKKIFGDKNPDLLKKDDSEKYVKRIL